MTRHVTRHEQEQAAIQAEWRDIAEAWRQLDEGLADIAHWRRTRFVSRVWLGICGLACALALFLAALPWI